MSRSGPHDEAARLAVLRGLEVLDTPAEAAFDALAASAARITGCPVALISLVGEDRLWFKARVGLDVESTARHPSLCDHAIRSDELLEVPDLRIDERFHDSPLVTGKPHLRFYAGQPLNIDGHRIGALCVLDAVPHRLEADDRRLLTQLANATVELLLSRRRLLEGERDRQRLLDFGRAGGDWMWESDAQHRYVWISETFEARTGLDPSALIGQPLSDFEVLGPNAEPVQPPLRYREVLARQAPFARVIGAKPTPRGPLLLSRSAVPFIDTAGRFAGYRGTIRDVTTQMRATGRVRERDERLAKLASQVPGVVFQYQWHPDGRTSYPYVSERAREVLGTAMPPGGTGTDPSMPMRLVHPDDRAGFERRIAESARTLARLVHEYRIVRPDGRVRWLDTFATPERLADGSVLWHGFTADITARREAEVAQRQRETQWQIAAAAAQIGLARVSRADHLVQLDAQALANHGLAELPPDFTLDAFLATIDAADRPAAEAGIHKLLSEDSLLEGRYRVHRPDGSVRWLEFVVRASRDAEGRIDGLVATCRDVHEQQAAAQLERARIDAERASRAKSEFLSRLSHELRTPLNGILGFAQLMAIDREQPLSGRQAQRLASMRHAGMHLLGLINDVLEISRHDTADSQWELQPVDLDAAIDSAMGLVQPLAQQQRVRLRREPADTAAAGAVLGEPRRLEQVLVNLLTNAIKFSTPGSEVVVRAEGGEQASRVAVIDKGPGLEPQQVARLFQPFERLGAEKLQVEGVGLGLYIARQLVEAMGGRIEVASRPGSGSTFSVVLKPAATAPAPVAAPQLASAAAAPVPLAAAAPARRIVYVEDEALNQLLFQEVVRGRPHWQLHIASDGATALRMASALEPDLMLIDINLPDMTGLSLVTTLRGTERTRGLRCIALSADAMSEQIEAARRAGFDDYWTKPIDVAQVLNRLDSLLGDAA